MFKPKIALIITLLIFAINFLEPIFAINFNIFTIGYGPLAGESGYPSMCDADSNGNIAILDGLKNTAILYDKNFSFQKSFVITNKINRYISGITFKFSLDNNLFVSFTDEIYKYDLNGNLLKSYLIREKPFLAGKIIKSFVPLKEDRILAKDEITGKAFITSLEKNEEPKYLKINDNDQIIDIDCYNGSLFALLITHNTGITEYNIYKFSESGDFIKETKLELQQGSLDVPSKISVSPDGKIFVFSNSFTYFIYDDNLQFLLSNNVLNVPIINLPLSIVAYLDEQILIPVPDKGVLLFKGQNLVRTVAPVTSEEGKLFLPTNISANNSDIFLYDDLTDKINYYVYENLKRSFPITELFGPATLTQSKIELNATKDGNLFITSIGIELIIKKYNPQNGDIKTIKIPEYIPPRSSVYVRPEDNKIFIYSWFDSILYSFYENVDNVEKVVIKRNESPIYGSDNICRVDSSENVFILSPVSKKVYVFGKNGDLILNFNLNNSAYYCDFKFFSDYVAFLDQLNGKVELYSKRGEAYESIGEVGIIQYPRDKSGYKENLGKFNSPSSISCTNNKIYVADSGNSRIQVLETITPQQKITIELQVGLKSAYVNGERKELDAPPFIENGRTLVPFRFIGEALGAKIDWIAEEKKAVYELNNIKVEVIIGSTTAYVNGKPITLEVPAKISNGRTFVPLRFVSEALGASVIWEAQTKRIVITYPGET